MTYTLDIGSVLSGTLRTEDLLNAFVWELRRTGAHNELIAEIDAIEDYESEEADDLVTDALDALNEHCPPYCYFGAHPGDGADIGCWPIELEDIDAPRISDPCELDDLPADESEAVFVNDHGNVTLYARNSAGEWHEVWSIV